MNSFSGFFNRRRVKVQQHCKVMQNKSMSFFIFIFLINPEVWYLFALSVFLLNATEVSDS